MSIDVYEVVTKLIGPIKPVGETHVDDRRYENLKAMADLVDSLLGDLCRVTPEAKMDEYSRQRAGKYAKEFLINVGIDID